MQKILYEIEMMESIIPWLNDEGKKEYQKKINELKTLISDIKVEETILN